MLSLFESRMPLLRAQAQLTHRQQSLRFAPSLIALGEMANEPAKKQGKRHQEQSITTQHGASTPIASNVRNGSKAATSVSGGNGWKAPFALDPDSADRK